MKALSTFIIIFFCLSFPQTAICQGDNLDTRAWAKKLADPADLRNEAFYSLEASLIQMDSLTAFTFLNKLNSESTTKNAYFLARYNCLMVRIIWTFDPANPAFSSNFKEDVKNKVTRLLEEAMDQTYITDDDYLAAFVNYVYGDAMRAFQYTAKAVMYLMYSAELYEKVHLKGEYFIYLVLGELLWKIREYEKCIEYTKIAITVMAPGFVKKEMMCNNTIGLAYHYMGQYDSAIYFYENGLRLAPEVRNQTVGKIWIGIISGNRAQIYYAQKKYTTALPAFEFDYKTNNEYGFYGDAANSLQWAAKTNLALGNKDLALRQIRETFNF